MALRACRVPPIGLARACAHAAHTSTGSRSMHRCCDRTVHRVKQHNSSQGSHSMGTPLSRSQAQKRESCSPVQPSTCSNSTCSSAHHPSNVPGTSATQTTAAAGAAQVCAPTTTRSKLAVGSVPCAGAPPSGAAAAAASAAQMRSPAQLRVCSSGRGPADTLAPAAVLAAAGTASV